MSNEISVVNNTPAIHTSPLNPKTFSELIRFSEIAAKSGMVPKDYIRNPSAIVIACQMGAELGLAPMQSLQNIAVINGRPSVWGDAMLALVKASPVCDDVIESFEGQDDHKVAICVAKRKGKKPVIARFGVSEAIKAGLWGNNVWKKYPDRMLQMRARGFALRDAFPDVLRGLITAEEARDISSENNYVDTTAVEVDKNDIKKEKKKLSPDKSLEVARKMSDDFMNKIMLCSSLKDLKELTSMKRYQDFVKRLDEVYPEIAEEFKEFVSKSIEALSSHDDHESDENAEHNDENIENPLEDIEM